MAHWIRLLGTNGPRQLWLCDIPTPSGGSRLSYRGVVFRPDGSQEPQTRENQFESEDDGRIWLGAAPEERSAPR